MSSDVTSDRSKHALAGLAVSLVGVALLVVPAYDIYDDVTSLAWNPLTTAVENTTFVVLASGLVGAGVWLAGLDWEPRYVRMVTKRTLAGTAVVLVLVAVVVGIQEIATGSLNPYVIAMDAILIGATASFGLGLYSAKARRQTEELTETSQLNRHLETLHEYTSELEAVEDRDVAYAIVRDAVDALLDGRSVWVVVDGRRVVDVDGNHGTDPAVSAPVGDYGYVALGDENAPFYERETVDLLGVHLEHALERIDRQDAISKQRERLEFVNRTVRDNLLNDVNVVSSRLQLLEPRPGDREHWETIVDRVDGMGSFIQTMRKYTNTIAGDGPDTRPIPLEPTLAEKVESVQLAYPDADVSVDSIPEVAVLADELLGPVFENPLTNAIEHHDGETPIVEVETNVREDVVEVSFADDGPGIADDRKDRVFERGETAGMSAGTGFGLYLVKDVVEPYGGTVDITDNDPRGTVVELELPLADD